MTLDELSAYIGGLEGVLTLAPGPGDGSPEISWGDLFFYYAPDGVVPRTQPFATIVTKDYPDDRDSRLDRPGAFRLNVAAGTEEFERRLGRTPESSAVEGVESAVEDVIPHPVYASLGWLAVVNPGSRAELAVRELVRHAHALARSRVDRRAAVRGGSDAAEET